MEWEKLMLGRLFNGEDEQVPRSMMFIRMGSAFRRPKNELNFILNHMERKGFVEKFRIGNGDYFYRRKVMGEPIFKRAFSL